MGYVGDLMSRSRALFITLAVGVVGAVMSAAAPPSPGSSSSNPSTVYAVIIVFRFVLGFGLGGIFPLSAAKAAEDGAAAVGVDGGKVSSVASSWLVTHVNSTCYNFCLRCSCTFVLAQWTRYT